MKDLISVIRMYLASLVFSGEIVLTLLELVI